MPHTIDQSRFVEDLPVQKGGKVALHLFLILPVFYNFLHILKHHGDLLIGPAMPRPFQGAKGGRYRRIGIRAGGGDDMIGKSRVVSPSVLRVEYQRDIQYLRLQRSKPAVRPKHM